MARRRAALAARESTMKNMKPVCCAAFSLAVQRLCVAASRADGGGAPGAQQAVSGFTEDDVICRNFANNQVASTAQQASSAIVGSAVVGTLLGAGLGAAIGRGPGAAIGAASGAIIGTGTAANGRAWSQMCPQQRYNIAYMQCMYSRKSGARLYGRCGAPSSGSSAAIGANPRPD
jgi:hypothetical protein